MNDVTITLENGTVIVLTQDQILEPKFDCSCYMGLRKQDYIRKIMESGIITVTDDGEGNFTYDGYSPHCICHVSVNFECP